MRFASVVMMLLAALPAFGWGPHAHRVVAAVAEKDLPDDVAQKVRTLVAAVSPGTKSLADIATKPDSEWLMTRPESRAWHFVEIPFDQPRYSASRDCSDGHCIVAAIQRFEKVLADPNASEKQRGEALIYLTHLIADIHQPLHVTSKNDRGANTLRITYGGQLTSLHSFWDSRMFGANPNVAGDARRITDLRATLPLQEQRSLGMGNAEGWANESHGLRHFVYSTVSPNAELSPTYVRQSRAAADKQLLRAAQRLRAVVIRHLGGRS